MGQYPRAHFPVECESDDACPYGQYKHALWSINSVSRGNLFIAGLEKVSFLDVASRRVHRRLQHRENSSDGYVHINIGGTIQRIKEQKVFTLGVAVRNAMQGFHFF